VSASQIFWTAGGHIVFPWEGDGWTHMYAVPAGGGRARLLTPGAFEVEYVALAPGGRALIYSSNQDDIDRRHIWRVSIEDGPPVALTKGTGIEWSPLITGDGTTVAMLRSGPRRPAHPAIRLENGEIRELAPPLEYAGFVEPQAVTVTATDGMPIPAQLFLPRGLKPGDRRPAAIFLHGGSRRQMLLGFHYSPYYHNAYAMNQCLASRGYIVLSLNYRSGIGYGMEFREALRYGAAGASEFQDVLGAGLYLRGRAEVDPKRIGLWGGSYGGYLTAMGLSRASDLFAAGVDIHGVHDWNVVIRNFDRSYDPARRPDAARLAFESSPMASIRGWRSPVLLIHGDDDRNVPFSETLTLAEALRGQGVPFEQLIFPDEVHSFLRYRSWVRAFEAAAAFFDKHLGK
jgi:dipeptidyl aminopeptidase/acylaminoacyl peptidase